jgi:ferric-dicitrate binding protein FerR (iron transport regulator)
LKENKREKSAVLKIFRWYSKIAAVLLIPMLAVVSYLTWKNSGITSSSKVEATRSTLFAPMGSRIEFSLPDGTKGWLNSGSSLTYSLPFTENRKLNLRGEAYFDVAHSMEYPFEISSGEARIKVLGTKFNVSAYPAEKYIEVVLEEGKVEFSHPGMPAGVGIKPSERIVFENGRLSRSETDPSKFTAWVEGKLVFRGDPMAEVARRIERWYNVEVRLMDNEIANYVFRGTFQDDSLEEVLRVLSMTSPLKYKISGRKLLDNGTYEKGQVLLYYKDSDK